jgi:hypothetical protein
MIFFYYCYFFEEREFWSLLGEGDARGARGARAGGRHTMPEADMCRTPRGRAQWYGAMRKGVG